MQIVVYLLFELESVLLDFKTIRVERAPHQIGHIGFSEAVFFLARLDTREVQDIVDQRSQPLTLFANDLVIFLTFSWVGDASQFERLCVKADERQRRSQLVRDVRDKIGFQFRQRKFARDVSIGEQHPTTHQQRKGSESEEGRPHKVVADVRERGPAQLHSENQSGEDSFEPTLYFRRTSIPTNRSSQRSVVLCSPDHDYRFMGCIVFVLIWQHFVERLRKKLVA